MTLCSSGSLSICGTAGTNRSISTEVGGGSGSLSALSVSAGKSAPHGMLEFYGYSSAPTDVFYTSVYSCTGINYACCLSSIPVPAAGGCYSVSFTYNNNSDGIKIASIACIFCNGTCKYGCSFTATGTFPVFNVFAGDTVCVCTLASALFQPAWAFGCSDISTVQTIVGSSITYALGGGRVTQASLAGSVP